MAQPVIDPFGEQALDVWTRDRSIGKQVIPLAERMKANSLTALRNALIPAGNVAGLDPATLALGADFSHWNSEVDPSIIAQLDFMACKITDGKQIYPGSGSDLGNYKDKTADTNIDKAYKRGIPVIIYHYFQPVIEAGWKEDHIIKWQYDIIKSAIGPKIPGKSFHAICIDVEQKGDTNTNYANKVMGLADMLHGDPALAGLPILLYTSKNWLNTYSPALEQRAGRPDHYIEWWMAQWAYSKTTQTTWDEIRSKYIPSLNMRVMEPGNETWRILQWSAAFKPPTASIPLDLNFFHGTKEAAYKWLNYKQAQPPAEPPSEPGTPGQDDHSLDDRVEMLEHELAALKAAYTAHTHTTGKAQ